MGKSKTVVGEKMALSMVRYFTEENSKYPIQPIKTCIIKK